MFAYYQTASINDSVQVRKTATVHYCQLHSTQPQTRRSRHIRHVSMGNTSTTSQMSNYSRRNVRVFLTETAQEMDAFITSQADEEKGSSPLPAGKKFSFRKDINCVRVLASQTQEVPWEPQHFLSVFVEDEDDENVCSKQIIHNMALSAPITVLLYDV